MSDGNTNSILPIGLRGTGGSIRGSEFIAHEYVGITGITSCFSVTTSFPSMPCMSLGGCVSCASSPHPISISVSPFTVSWSPDFPLMALSIRHTPLRILGLLRVINGIVPSPVGVEVCVSAPSLPFWPVRLPSSTPSPWPESDEASIIPPLQHQGPSMLQRMIQ